MDQYFDIFVDTSQPMTRSVVIEAKSETDETTLVDLIIYVRNFAPYFKDG